MDVLSLSTKENSSKGVRMPLRHPETGDVLEHKAKGDDAPREMFLVLLGPDAGPTRREAAKFAQRSRRRKPDHVPSDDELEADVVAEAKALAQLTVGGLVFMRGEWVEITKDNAFDLYYTVDAFRTQASGFCFDRANFTKAA